MGDREQGMVKIALLRFVAVTLLVGGAFRVFATRALFHAFGIGDLWMQTPYAVYIYRILGGFVVLSGIILMIVSGSPGSNRRLLKGYALGFAFIGVIMLVSGLITGLPSRYYLPDPVYCFLIVALLWHSSR
jgi:hypothetical protein